MKQETCMKLCHMIHSQFLPFPPGSDFKSLGAYVLLLATIMSDAKRQDPVSFRNLVLYAIGITAIIWLFYQLKCRFMGALVFDFEAE